MATAALNSKVEWKETRFQGIKFYDVLGDRDVLLITSTEVKHPDAVAHSSAQLTDKDREKLANLGISADSCNDAGVMMAKYELDTRFHIAGVEQSTFEHPLTTSYVKSKIKELFKKSEKAGVQLYYCGPGRKGTGDWCFADGFITFQDIADLYMESFVGSVLVIDTDCSYSGSWEKSCMEFLDKQGVQPCGHSARDKGILIKVQTSCRANEVAQSLYYSVRVKQNDKNTRDLFYAGVNTDDPQHRIMIRSTLIRCDNKTIELPCTLAPDYTWQKEQAKQKVEEAKKRVFLVRGTDHGRPAWHYVLLVDDEEIKQLFHEKVKSGTVDVADYGKVIQSGWGEDPPNEVVERMENEDFTTYR